MAIAVYLESATESISLNQLVNATTGAQAIAGLTGFGLPPVDVKWTEGASDGATYRGRRVLPRDIDIPLYFAATNRGNLQAQVAKLSRILAGEATLRLVDGPDEWYAKVARVGGGDFIYGEETDGEMDLNLTISLRAGSPYWTSTALTTVTQTNTGIGPTIVLPNTGDLSARPVWEITGPGENLVITAPNGETLSWAARLTDGEKITIDTVAGTVVNELGLNRYGSLSTAPKFSDVPLGGGTFSLSFPTYASSLSRTNLIINPSLETNATGWSGGGTATRKTSGGIQGTSVWSGGTAPAPVSGFYFRGNYEQASGGVALNASTTYTVSWYVKVAAGSVNIGPGFETYGYVDHYDGSANYVGTNSSAHSYITLADGWVRKYFTFTTPISGARAKFYLMTGTSVNSVKGATGSEVLYDGLLVETGTDLLPYFDGSTTSTATKTYAWTGTAHASTSTMTSTPVRANAKVEVKYPIRKWMAV